MSDSDEVVVKKIKPYPITARMEVAGEPAPTECRILKLTLDGAMIDTMGRFFKVGSSSRIRFELPVSHNEVISDVKIMKTYDRAALNGKTQRLAEVRFIGLADEKKKNIHSFLVTIRQKS